MGYTRGGSTQQSVLPVEQARRRNAELRIELAALTAENTKVGAKVEAMRLDLTVARRKLARQIRDLAAVRAQTANIAALAQHTADSEKYGGPEGLQAALAEIEAYEGDKLGTVKRSGPRHGSGRKYNLGCRCDACGEWRKRKSAQTWAGMQRKRAREIAAAVEQAVRAA